VRQGDDKGIETAARRLGQIAVASQGPVADLLPPTAQLLQWGGEDIRPARHDSTTHALRTAPAAVGTAGEQMLWASGRPGARR